MGRLSVLVGTAFLFLTWLLACGAGDTSIDGKSGDVEGYKAYPFREVYQPAPSATVHNVTSRQCARNCSEQAELECKHFQHCAAKGMQRGVCEFYVGDNIRLRTRPSDECTIYTNDDPAKHGIPHGASVHDGVSSHMTGPIHLLILLTIFVATRTFWRTLV
ncbi:uncharacterized protein LOC144177838 [Haemaphysalis longicornis]